MLETDSSCVKTASRQICKIDALETPTTSRGITVSFLQDDDMSNVTTKDKATRAVSYLPVTMQYRVTTTSSKRGFQPTQRTQRDEITSLLDRPITAASDDGVCRRHAAKLWQTRAKLLKLKFDLHRKLHNK